MTRDDERPDLAEREEGDADFERRFRAEYDATPPGAPRIVMPRDVVLAAGRRRAWLGGSLLAASAALVAATVTLANRPVSDPAVRVEAAPPPARPSGSALQVALVAPGATRVTVVGDFNRWDPNASPLARGADGSWRARIAVPPGRHEYAFVVDDDRWVTDPVAPRAPGLGLGQPNSVAIVPDAASR